MMYKFSTILITTLLLPQYTHAKCQWLDWIGSYHDKSNLISFATDTFEQNYFDWPIINVDFYHTHPTRVEVKITGQHTDGRTLENIYAYQELICGEVDEEKSLGQPTCPAAGTSPLANGTNPINAATGNKFQKEIDFTGVGEMPLTFTRYYNSQTTSNEYHIGQNWRHNYNRSILLISHTTPNGATIETEVRLSRQDGKTYSYYPNANGWSSEPDVLYQIEKLTDGWKVTTPDNKTESYDTAGRLVSIQSLSGHISTLLYDQNNQLYQINGPFNKSLTITYDSNNRINTVTTPNNETYTYTYDGSHNLIEIQFPNSAGTSDKQYHYTDPRYPHALTSITDENGNTYASWTYDDSNRAISSEHAGSTERVTITYNTDGSRTLSDSLGATRDYHYAIHYGVPNTSSILGGVCTSCSGDTKDFSYDANTGFLNSITDWEGNQTTYTYNTRGLEEERIEAVGTPQERKTTTQWHTVYRVPTIIELFDHNDTLIKRTTNTYDPNGRLIGEEIQSF